MSSSSVWSPRFPRPSWPRLGSLSGRSSDDEGVASWGWCRPLLLEDEEEMEEDRDGSGRWGKWRAALAIASSRTDEEAA